MTEVDIDARLQALTDLLENMKALLAWEQLKNEEARPGQPPGFTVQENIDADLKRLYSTFQMQALELRSLIDDQYRFILPEAQRQEYRRRFQHKDSELKRLSLPIRFINS